MPRNGIIPQKDKGFRIFGCKSIYGGCFNAFHNIDLHLCNPFAKIDKQPQP